MAGVWCQPDGSPDPNPAPNPDPSPDPVPAPGGNPAPEPAPLPPVNGHGAPPSLHFQEVPGERGEGSEKYRVGGDESFSHLIRFFCFLKKMCKKVSSFTFANDHGKPVVE